MHLVGHFIARNELPSGGMTGEHDDLEVGKDALVRQLPKDFIEKIEGRQLRVTRRGASGSPAVAAATPAHFVGRQRVLALAFRRPECRGDDDRVAKRAGEKGRAARRGEVVVGVS